MDSLEESHDNSSDKKANRNPNWTEREVVRFLELMHEDDILMEMAMSKNKHVTFIPTNRKQKHVQTFLAICRLFVWLPKD